MPFFGGGGGGGSGGDYQLLADNNVAGGDFSLLLVSGVNNMALGNAALQDTVAGNYNIAIGTSANKNNESENKTVVICADESAEYVLSGTVFIGNSTTGPVSIGQNSVYLGSDIDSSDGLGYENVIVGAQNKLDGNGSVVIGSNSRVSGSYGIAIGAGAKNDGGSDSLVIGYNITATSAGSGSISILGGSVSDGQIRIGPTYLTDVRIGKYTLNGSVNLSSTWAALPDPTTVVVGDVYRVTDVGVNGSLWYSNGSKWCSVSSSIVLIAPTPVPAGQLFDVSTSEALFGSYCTIPAGVLKAGNKLRVRVDFSNPVIGSDTRSISVRMTGTLANILTGAVINGYATSNATNNVGHLDKQCIVMDNTTIKRANMGNISGGIISTGISSDQTIPDSSANDLYAGICIAPSSGTSILVFDAALILDMA